MKQNKKIETAQSKETFGKVFSLKNSDLFLPSQIFEKFLRTFKCSSFAGLGGGTVNKPYATRKNMINSAHKNC